MIYVLLVILGLSLGSFVNALVWRLREQSSYFNDDGSRKAMSKSDKLRFEKLSITKGRSMCARCGHTLAPSDLIPVISWLRLGGRCRYCRKKFDDTPLAEILLPSLFILSYVAWPYALSGRGLLEVALFAAWLMILTCFLALAIYDARWYILPDRIVLPLTGFSLLFAALESVMLGSSMVFVLAILGGVTVGGVFLLLSILSKGEWIGGGDVKIGFSLGLLAGTPLLGCLVIFMASLLATVFVLPQMIKRNTKLRSRVPFGPFLIVASFIVVLWGTVILTWYSDLLLA